MFIRIVRDVTGNIGEQVESSNSVGNKDKEGNNVVSKYEKDKLDLEEGSTTNKFVNGKSNDSNTKSTRRRLEMNKSIAKCGCSNFLLITLSAFFGILTLAGFIVGGALLPSTDTGASLGFAFGILFLIFFIIVMSSLFCACCRFPIDD